MYIFHSWKKYCFPTETTQKGYTLQTNSQRTCFEKEIWSWYKLNSSKLKKIKLLLESYCALNWIVIQPNVEDKSTLRAKWLTMSSSVFRMKHLEVVQLIWREDEEGCPGTETLEKWEEQSTMILLFLQT